MNPQRYFSKAKLYYYILLWEPSTGTSHRLPKTGIQETTRQTRFPWQPTDATCIVASSVFTWVRLNTSVSLATRREQDD
jgi:hypothetical protein